MSDAGSPLRMINQVVKHLVERGGDFESRVQPAGQEYAQGQSDEGVLAELAAGVAGLESHGVAPCVPCVRQFWRKLGDRRRLVGQGDKAGQPLKIVGRIELDQREGGLNPLGFGSLRWESRSISRKPFDHRIREGEHQVLPGRKVIVDRRVVDSDFVCDAARVERLHSVRTHEIVCCVEDLCATMLHGTILAQPAGWCNGSE